MKKKMMYEAPEMSVLQFRTEGIINASVNVTSGPETMTTHEASEWGEWE